MDAEFGMPAGDASMWGEEEMETPAGAMDSEFEVRVACVMAIHRRASTVPELPEGIEFRTWKDEWLHDSIIESDTVAAYEANAATDEIRAAAY